MQNFRYSDQEFRKYAFLTEQKCVYGPCQANLLLTNEYSQQHYGR